MPTTDTGLNKDTILSFSFQGFMDYIAQQQADNIKEYDERLSAIVAEEEYIYETPEKFCHRHIVAKWLNEKLNLNI